MKRIVLFIALGFCANSLVAQDMTPMQNVAEFTTILKKQSAETKTIKADFTEEKHMAVLKEPQKSTGVFYYKKADMLRWEKTKPNPYVFLSANNKVKIKDSGKEKDVSSFNQVIGRIKDLMLTLVNGEFEGNKMFAPTYFENATSYIVKLQPKSKKMANMFDYIQLTFSKKSLLLDEMAFFEKSGDKNKMKFYNQKVNENLDDQLFLNF